MDESLTVASSPRFVRQADVFCRFAARFAPLLLLFAGVDSGEVPSFYPYYLGNQDIAMVTSVI